MCVSSCIQSCLLYKHALVFWGFNWTQTNTRDVAKVLRPLQSGTCAFFTKWCQQSSAVFPLGLEYARKLMHIIISPMLMWCNYDSRAQAIWGSQCEELQLPEKILQSSSCTHQRVLNNVLNPTDQCVYIIAAEFSPRMFSLTVCASSQAASRQRHNLSMLIFPHFWQIQSRQSLLFPKKANSISLQGLLHNFNNTVYLRDTWQYHYM